MGLVGAQVGHEEALREEKAADPGGLQPGLRLVPETMGANGIFRVDNAALVALTRLRTVEVGLLLGK